MAKSKTDSQSLTGGSSVHMWPEGKSIETKIIKQGTTWNHSEMLGYFQKV